MKKTKFYLWTKRFGHNRYDWNLLGFGFALFILAGITVLLILSQVAKCNAVL